MEDEKDEKLAEQPPPDPGRAPSGLTNPPPPEGFDPNAKPEEPPPPVTESEPKE